MSNAVPNHESLKAHYLKVAQDAAKTLSQQQAIEHLLPLKLPTLRDESWRYTPLAPILGQAFHAVQREEDLLTVDDVQQARATPLESPCLVFLNGFYQADLSVLPADGSVLVDAHSHTVMPTAVFQQSFFAGLNAASADTILVRLKAQTTSAQPLEILHFTYSFESNFIAQPRLHLLVEEGAQAMVIEQHLSLADTLCFTNQVLQIEVGKGAQLTHPRLQNESLRARHLSHVSVHLAEDSRYQSTNIALGSTWSRVEWQVAFKGEHAYADLNGFYLSGANQSHDMQLSVLHRVPNCSSSEQFKGILHANGRAIFDGNIVVAQDAQKTDAQLNNANLVLSRDAEVYTKPRLEIYADDVKCSHGTTVGQLDPEALFYLRARGIPKQDAITMVASGFAGSMLETCGFEPLQARVMQMLTQQLTEAAASI
ncbi:Fe-S cluster assembly protein SufD [Thiolinea disciformis]|uniref:Fe-S cluster assembly protein SufD n=1 Tax=Thiolinea disciformis TaxID=125614 RepID=UPI000380D929|nr:Fe-S cluster assembly protein SufD [Thiolinea disciformis]